MCVPIWVYYNPVVNQSSFVCTVTWVDWCSFDVITFPCSLFCCSDTAAAAVKTITTIPLLLQFVCLFFAIKIHKHLFDSCHIQKACQFTLERHWTHNTHCKWQLTVHYVCVCNGVHSTVQWKLDFCHGWAAFYIFFCVLASTKSHQIAMTCL